MTTPRAAGSRVLITGGAGYIGSVLTPHLLERGHEVAIVDLCSYGREHIDTLAEQYEPQLTVFMGDIRDEEFVSGALESFAPNTVIHLAAISNDPSSELDADLTLQVNRLALEFVMRRSKELGVTRFLYASSASVYGIKEEECVDESLPLEPITLYAKYKAEGEGVLNALADGTFCGVSVRAATVCGWSPRLRLDLTINILTAHALADRVIRVFGGNQMRPNVHVRDLVDLYTLLLDAPAEDVNGQAFNVSFENASVKALAEMIRDELGDDVSIEFVPTNDLRSYRLDASKLAERLGFEPSRPLLTAVRELADAKARGVLDDWTQARFYNVRHMKSQIDTWRTW